MIYYDKKPTIKVTPTILPTFLAYCGNSLAIKFG